VPPIKFAIKIEGLSARIVATILGSLRMGLLSWSKYSPFEFPELGGKVLRDF